MPRDHMTLFRRRAIALTATLLCSTTAWPVDSTMTQGGFTGLSITPNANILGWGRFDFAYDRQLPGAVDPTGHNFVAGFGLLPNIEVSGRVAANSPMNANCFISACGGIRDLSASVKGGIGLDAAGRYRIAFGAADIGGAATNFRSYYGVLTYGLPEVEVSGGFARRSSTAGGSQSPLDGPFASAAWQPLPWIRGHVEYTDRNAWAGVRLFAPQQWLPGGWSAHIGATARLTDTNLTRRTWLNAGISIPLYRVPGQAASSFSTPANGTRPPMPEYQAQAIAPPATPAPAASTSIAVPASDASLQELAADLRKRGLEDIYVGRMGDGSIAVRANNATYNWNSLDALGAALGSVAHALGDSRSAYRLILTQRQLPLVAVTGQADCLRRWIQEPTAGCAAGELTTPGAAPLDALHAGASWVVERLQPSSRTVRVALTPILRTNIATEAGVLDYSAGVGAHLSWPLWSGASVDWRVQTQLAASDDYKRGGAFYRRHILGGTERLSFTQTMRLPMERWLGVTDPVRIRNAGLGAVTAQASAGRFGSHFDGVSGSVRWEPGEGRHRVTAQGGWFRNSDFGAILGEARTAIPLLATYRYNISPTRTYVEATGGRFMNNDGGVQLGMRQWFSDVAVQVYVRRTKFSNSAARNMAGLEISVPIGPRRDMNPSLFQVTGTPRFSHYVETMVGAGANAVTTGYGVLPPVPSLDAVHNSDRSGLVYFEDNLHRVREAAR
ncbi:MAG: hypothetical protein JWP41_4357 [Ramlibacter sp.]|nr:hypothetical protein [Ramlibacter sp.]